MTRYLVTYKSEHYPMHSRIAALKRAAGSAGKTPALPASF